MKRETQKIRWLLLLGCLFLFAQRGAASTSLFSAANHLASSASQFVIADFDGDRRPDLATVEIAQVDAHSARYSIRIRFASGARESLGVSAALGGLRIASRDVNGDFALDLIVTSALLHKPVAVLLNDGHGRFTSAPPALLSAVTDDFQNRRRGLSQIRTQIEDHFVLASANGLFSGEQQERSLDPPRILSQPLAHHFCEIPLSLYCPILSGRAPPVSAL